MSVFDRPPAQIQSADAASAGSAPLALLVLDFVRLGTLLQHGLGNLDIHVWNVFVLFLEYECWPDADWEGGKGDKLVLTLLGPIRLEAGEWYVELAAGHFEQLWALFRATTPLQGQCQNRNKKNHDLALHRVGGRVLETKRQRELHLFIGRESQRVHRERRHAFLDLRTPSVSMQRCFFEPVCSRFDRHRELFVYCHSLEC